MQEAKRFETIAVAPLKPEQPKTEPVKPEWGDEVADTILNPITGKVKKVSKRWFGING